MDALDMSHVALMAALAVAVLGGAVGIVAFWRRVRRFSGDRLVQCPETHRPAAVRLDAMSAASREELRLQDCSRWPEREGCGQECLAQIEHAADGCLVRTYVANWYREHPCVLCGRTFENLDWQQHRPAVQWTDLRPEQLPELFETCEAVCWDCHVVETLYRKHPELVTERPGKWEKMARS
jgi:hypothetical protein